MKSIFEISHRNFCKKSVSTLAMLFFTPFISLAQTPIMESKSLEINYYFESKITSKTSDEDLSELQKNFTADGVTLEVPNVKRNAKGEIVGLHLRFKSSSRKQEKQWDGDVPINPIQLYIRNDRNNVKTFGFDEVTVDKMLTVYKKKAENLAKGTYYSLQDTSKEGRNIHVIYNGNLFSELDKVSIPLDEDVYVLREISPQEVMSKYNFETNESVVYYEMFTKKTNTTVLNTFNLIPKQEVVQNQKEDSFIKVIRKSISSEQSAEENESENKSQNEIILRGYANSNPNMPKTVLVDGEEISLEDFKNIDPNDILVVSVFKEGVQVETKNGINSANSNVILRGYTQMNTKVQTQFEITKSTTDSELEALKTAFLQKEIKLKFSGIKRNAKKEITSITINMTDKAGSKQRKKLTQSMPIDPIRLGIENDHGFIRN